VASVLRSAAVKKIVPTLSTRVERVFLCLAAILNLRNARVLFITAKRHPVRNSQFMKAIRDVHSLFQDVAVPTLQHGATPQKTLNFILAAVRT
jgi:hypothetical protein